MDSVERKDIIQVRVIDVLKSFLLMFLALVVMFLMVRFSPLASYKENIPSKIKEYYMLFVLLSVGIVYLIRKYPIDKYIYGFQSVSIKGTLLWGIFGGIFLTILNFPFGSVIKGIGLTRSVEIINLESGAFFYIQYFVFAIVIIPIFEEIFYRGLVYRILKYRLDISWSALITSAIFGVVHLNIMSALFSIVLIYLFERSKYLGAPIVAHSIMNLAWCIVNTWILK